MNNKTLWQLTAYFASDAGSKKNTRSDLYSGMENSYLTHEYGNDGSSDNVSHNLDIYICLDHQTGTERVIEEHRFTLSSQNNDEDLDKRVYTVR